MVKKTALVLFMILMCREPSRAQSFRFTFLDGVGRATAINNNSQIVGYSIGGQQTHGIFYSAGQTTQIVVPGASNTFAYGINNGSQIVGSADALAAGTFGFTYSSGSFATITVAGSTGTVARSINDSGQIVGYARDSAGRQNGFLYSRGSFTPIKAPGSFSTYPYGINNAGQIVGMSTDAAGRQSGFLYDKGTFTPIEVPDSSATFANGINNAGEIVGSFIDSSGTHGFIYSGGTFTTINSPAAPTSTGTTLAGVNDAGQVVGYSVTSFLATPTASPLLSLAPQFGIYSGAVGVPVTYTFTASGGSAPYSWTAGNLLAGVSLVASANTAVLTGVPLVAGPSALLQGVPCSLPYGIDITVADRTGQTKSQGYLLTLRGAAAPQISSRTEQTVFKSAETRSFSGLQQIVSSIACLADPACRQAAHLIPRVLNSLLLSNLGVALADLANNLGIPDSDFTKIAAVQYPRIRTVERNGVNRQLASALNDLISNQGNQQGLSFALLASLNRSSGARLAQNTYWREKQLQTAKWYALQLGRYKQSEPALARAVSVALAGTNLDLKLDSDLVMNTRLEIARSGLNPEQTAFLSGAGFTPDELPFLQRMIAAANSTSSAQTLSQALVDETLTSSGTNAASAILIFGADRNNDGTVDCSDLGIIRAAFGTQESMAGFNVMADVNVDGAVDVRDLALVARQTPASSSCQ